MTKPVSRIKREVKSFGALAAVHAPSLRDKKQRIDGQRTKVLVSLTSQPPRITSVWATVESLLRQSSPPDRIVLVLSLEEFPERLVPARLLKMKQRGLQVMWTPENIRSYKKLLPVMTEHANCVIVTADDDTIYPRHWLEALLRRHEAHPKEIVGHRGTEVMLTDGRLMPYLQWPQASARTPSNRVFLTGMGGILYPPGSLPDTTLDHNLALALCPSADDIWFWTMALLAGTPVHKLVSSHGDFATLRTAADASALWRFNVPSGRNDEQLVRALDHFALWPMLAGPRV